MRDSLVAALLELYSRGNQRKHCPWNQRIEVSALKAESENKKAREETDIQAQIDWPQKLNITFAVISILRP